MPNLSSWHTRSRSQSPPHLELTQELDHLGFRLDTKNMTLVVPKTKLRNFRREGSEAQSSRNGPQYTRALIPSSAKPIATTAPVSPACLITQHLTVVNNAALKAGASLPYRPRSKTNSTGGSLCSVCGTGCPGFRHPTQLDVYTDASTSG